MAVYAFDVGEVLVDENRLWTRHAQQIGVAPFTFFGVMGAIISQGGHHREVFEHFEVDYDRFRSNLDFRNRTEDGIMREDLYPDAIPTLRALQRAGHKVVIAGNQPKRATKELRDLDLPVDIIGSSAEWGEIKPSKGFFRRIALESGGSPKHITYVGDRVDNDVIPAQRVGFRAILIKRGPWGHIHATWPDAARADAVITSLRMLL